MPVTKSSIEQIPADKITAYVGDSVLQCERYAKIEWFQDYPYIESEEFLSPVGIHDRPVQELFILYLDGRVRAFGDKGTVKAFPSFDRSEWQMLEVRFDPKHVIVKS